MQQFSLFVIGLVLFWALITTLKAALEHKRVRADAVSEYDYRAQEGMIDKRLTRDSYMNAYIRYNAPRSTIYIAAVLWVIILLTYPAVMTIQFLLDKWWVLSGRPEVIEPGLFVWQFMLFFSVIGFWALIAYIAARRYHSRAMVSFEHELEKEIS